MSQQQHQQDMEAIVNALLRQIKQQPVKTDIQQPTWVEKRLGAPKSAEEILWRFAWLVCVPAIATLLSIPVAVWLWTNGYPMVPIAAIASVLLIYWFVYQFAVNESGKLQTLVEMQLCIPVATAFFIVAYEVLKHG